jgi:hypothetical protein
LTRRAGAHPLRIGLSVTVDVDTGDASGTPVAAVPAATSQTGEEVDRKAAVEARIAAIIAANRRRAVSAPAAPGWPRPPPLLGGLLTVALALALGTFMQVLDSTIANVALNTIAGNLGESSTATWVITAFAVANGVTVPLTGWLMRRFGVVTTFTASVALFTVASFLCGLEPALADRVPPVAGRGFRPDDSGQSGAAAGDLPAGKAHRGPLDLVDDGADRAGAGADLGGYISDNYHWGWIFLINVPVGFITVGVLMAKMRPYNTPPMKLPSMGRAGAADPVGRLAAGGARPGQGRGLVQFHLHLRDGVVAAIALSPGSSGN